MFFFTPSEIGGNNKPPLITIPAQQEETCQIEPIRDSRYQ